LAAGCDDRTNADNFANGERAKMRAIHRLMRRHGAASHMVAVVKPGRCGQHDLLAQGSQKQPRNQFAM